MGSSGSKSVAPDSVTVHAGKSSAGHVTVSQPRQGVASNKVSRLRKHRSSFLQTLDNSVQTATQALDDIEARLASKPQLLRETRPQLDLLREFFRSKGLRDVVLHQGELNNLREHYQQMRRDSEFNPELGAYMAQQFGVPTEKKKQRRKSTTLGATVAATLLAKRMKSNVQDVIKLAQTSHGLVSRLCGLAPTSIQKLQHFELRMNDWNFDMFEFHEYTQGNSLMAFGLTALSLHGLLGDSVDVKRTAAVHFLRHVQNGYIATNSYHNAIHAADVAQTLHVFMVASIIERLSLRPLEVFALLIAACVHDFKHPGVNNEFMIRSQSDLALTYNDVGVLENMHCAEAFRICKHDPRANIFEDFSRASVRAVRKLIVSAVLGTDMTHHFKKLAEFTATIAAEAEVAQELYISEGGDSGGACNSKLKLDDAQRLLAVTVCLHAADVSNPAKAPAVYKRWAYRVMDEFFLQGDQEAASGNDVSAFMDRSNPQPVKCQVGFIDYIVHPMFESLHALIPSIKPVVDANFADNRMWLASPGCFSDLPLDSVTGRYEAENRVGHAAITPISGEASESAGSPLPIAGRGAGSAAVE